MADLKPTVPIPADDPSRSLSVARPDDDSAPLVRLSIAGDTYTLLVTGKDSAGQYCLIDMHIPPGGGPPPHRHDFEEMFSVLEGEIELVFRGAKAIARAGETVNIPANAPHSFKNVSAKPARLLCMCTPAGQDEFFLEIGDRVATRTAPPTPLRETEASARRTKARSLAAKYRTELLPPPGE